MTETTRRVLLVEDNPELAKSMEFALTAFGWTVVGPVATSTDALDSLGQTPFDVAILDVELGDGRSFPVARELSRRGIPHLFLTGYVSTDEIPVEHRAVPCLVKPVAPAELVETLESLLASRP